MAKRYQIVIEKNNETYIIHRNKHFDLMIGECLDLYKIIISNIELYSQKAYSESDDFKALMAQVTGKEKKIFLSEKELTTLGIWIDINVLLIYELDAPIMNEEDKKMYFKILKIIQNFLDEIKRVTQKLIPTHHGIDEKNS